MTSILKFFTVLTIPFAVAFVIAEIPQQPVAVQTDPEKPPMLGFFSADGVEDYVGKVPFSMINVYPGNDGKMDLPRLRANLEKCHRHNHLLHLDVTHIISDVRDSRTLSREYENWKGRKRLKTLPLREKNKLKVIAPDEEIVRRMEGLPELVKEYRDNVGVLFLLDEPYLNGVSKAELERASRAIKRLFADSGVQDIQTGALFASAMFNRDFAKHINASMCNYADFVDSHHLHNQKKNPHNPEYVEWLKALDTARLQTYDSCSNIYTGGGLPKDVDFFAFNFYLSTSLLDQVHEHTFNWFAKRGLDYSCRQFRRQKVSEIRKRLSFFESEGIEESERSIESDKKLVDDLFSCRMKSTIRLLRRELEKEKLLDKPRVIILGESSANGVMHFDSELHPLKQQNRQEIEQRMLDEVRRSYEIYQQNRDIAAGLMYFVYPDSIDYSINLFISGAKGSPAVSGYIYDKAGGKVLKSPR